ncbi:MAG: 30S ribosomal protein S1 [Bacillaceae bacterium]
MVEQANELVIPNIGDIVKAIVENVEEKQVIVSIPGAKTDGIIPIKELSNVHIEKASDVVAKGEELTLKVKKIEKTKEADDEDNVVLILSKREVDAENAWNDLEEKLEKKETFSVKVREVVKGGLVVDVGIRGFIPASLISNAFVEDFSTYMDQELLVNVVELDREKKRVILSHRAVLEQEAKKQKQVAIGRIKEGDVLEGKVERLTNFGAFIDLGGVDGLVHVSQIAHQRVTDPSEVLEVGQTVNVKVLSVDLEKNKISLSIKETLPGPWAHVATELQVGAIVEGSVKRLANFGAFVEVLPGIEGLVHVSQIADKHIKHPKEVLEEGQVVKVKVLEVNTDQKRLSLSIKEANEEPKEDYSQYEPTKESSSFQLGELFAEKLKGFKTE